MGMLDKNLEELNKASQKRKRIENPFAALEIHKLNEQQRYKK